ncbi:hypothetical protein EBX93_18755 [bacterium]|nr:hypothetical protein [bacterium]
MKRHIAISDVLGFKTIRELAYGIKPKLSYRHGYIMLDSRYRLYNESKNANITHFSWGYYSGSRDIKIGAFNSSNDLENIICLKLHSFCMPYGVEFYDGTASYNRISVVIDELAAQSYIVSSDKRAHWILKHDEPPNASPKNKRIEFSISDFSNGEYWFNKPIVYIDGINIRIGSPMLPISFLYDRDRCQATYGNPTIITTTYPHLFTTSTYITMQNFTTNNVIHDSAIITAMNSKTEILATVIDANNLSIPIDTTSVIPKPGLIFNVFFEDRRLIMHMEVIYKIDANDNKY